MKPLLCFLFILTLTQAQYKKNTIDTHGGKSDTLFDKKNHFSNTNGLSLNNSLQKKAVKKSKNSTSKAKNKK
jgi:hypothetical protein